MISSNSNPYSSIIWHTKSDPPQKADNAFKLELWPRYATNSPTTMSSNVDHAFTWSLLNHRTINKAELLTSFMNCCLTLAILFATDSCEMVGRPMLIFQISFHHLYLTSFRIRPTAPPPASPARSEAIALSGYPSTFSTSLVLSFVSSFQNVAIQLCFSHQATAKDSPFSFPPISVFSLYSPGCYPSR